MSTRHNNEQRALSRNERAPDNPTPSEVDRLKLQELEVAFAKAKRELEVFCMETNQTSSLHAVENNSKDNYSEQAAFTDVDGDRCQSCGRGASEAEVRGGNETYRQPIPRAACCVITRVVDADGEFQTRYTNTTLGGSNDGEWHAPSPEGGSMGAQISGSIELLADRVREDWGCERVFYKVFPDLPDEFNRVLMNHTQMRRTTNAGNDLETGELVL